MARYYIKKGKAPRVVKAEELSAVPSEGSVEVDCVDFSQSVCLGFDKTVFLVDNEKVGEWKILEAERFMKYLKEGGPELDNGEIMDSLVAGLMLVGIDFKGVILKMKDYKKPEESLTEAFIRYSKEFKK